MDPGARAELRMELVQLLSSQLPEEAALGLFELASSDPAVFFAEVLGMHRSRVLVLPGPLLREVTRDFQNTQH